MDYFFHDSFSLSLAMVWEESRLRKVWHPVARNTDNIISGNSTRNSPKILFTITGIRLSAIRSNSASPQIFPQCPWRRNRLNGMRDCGLWEVGEHKRIVIQGSIVIYVSIMIYPLVDFHIPRHRQNFLNHIKHQRY